MKKLSVILSSGQTLHSRCIGQRHQEAASGCALPHRYFHQTKISREHHVSKRQGIKIHYYGADGIGGMFTLIAIVLYSLL